MTHADAVLEELDANVHKILKDDYIKTVKILTGTEITCMRMSTFLSVSSSVLTGLGSVLAFSAGFWQNDYLSYASGCTSVLAIVFMKAAYYANSQSLYQDAKLKNLLTKEYRLLHDFVKHPMTLPVVEEPTMPDPTQVNDLPISAPTPAPIQVVPVTPVVPIRSSDVSIEIVDSK
jgi:hypothetical protein